jgi:plasmid stabilization system protein ParE
MKYRLDHLPEVIEDITEARAWLGEQEAGLEDHFMLALEATVARIVENPEIYAPDEDGLRRVLMRPFQYHVGYVVRGDLVTILGVYHAKRHPGVWTTRPMPPER